MLWNSDSDPYCTKYTEKENIQQNLNLGKFENDESLHKENSEKVLFDEGSSHHETFSMYGLEEHENSSRDSGCCNSCQVTKTTRLSPLHENSFAEGQDDDSTDSGYYTNCLDAKLTKMDVEIPNLSDSEDGLNKNNDFLADFDCLISNNVAESKEKSDEFILSIKPLLRRCISEDNSKNSHKDLRIFKQKNVESGSIKRWNPAIDESNVVNIKRTRVLKNEDNNEDRILNCQLNNSEEKIKRALHRSFTEPGLIGNFTTSCCLPLISGRHPDLKSITPNTLVALIQGEFNDLVSSYRIIDCRYPYEYEGGHVAGSENFYTKDQISEELLGENLTSSAVLNPANRHILVFHCEFSSERAPKLYRFLRSADRMRNEETYPALHYPEVYLLEGGYKCFYEQFSSMCEPMAYKPMKHPEHQNDLRHFRSRTKTSDSDRSRTITRMRSLNTTLEFT